MTSDPAGIDCGGSCSETFSEGAGVTLTATADLNSTFIGWFGGVCTGADPCIVSMDATKYVMAYFQKENDPKGSGSGGGACFWDSLGN